MIIFYGLDLVKRLANKTLKFITQLPPVARYIANQTEKMLIEIDKDIGKTTSKRTFKIPDTGMSQEKISERLAEWMQRDNLLGETGKISGSLYLGPDKKFEQGVMDFSSIYYDHTKKKTSSTTTSFILIRGLQFARWKPKSFV